MTDSELVDEIERRIIENAPLAEILRMLLLLGGRLKSDKLQKWAKAQLNGYGSDETAPEVRTVGAPIYINAIVGNKQITGQNVSAAMLPKFAREVLDDTVTIRNSIAEVESMIESIKRGQDEVITLSLPGWEVIGREIDKAQAFQHTTAIYRRVHITELEGIIADGRNRTAELLGELRKSSKGESRVVTGRKVDEIVSGVTVTGSGHSVVIAQGRSKALSSAVEPASSWWGAWGRAATVITVITGIVALVVWLLTSIAGTPVPAP